MTNNPRRKAPAEDAISGGFKFGAHLLPAAAHAQRPSGSGMDMESRMEFPRRNNVPDDSVVISADFSAHDTSGPLVTRSEAASTGAMDPLLVDRVGSGC